MGAPRECKVEINEEGLLADACLNVTFSTAYEGWFRKNSRSVSNCWFNVGEQSKLTTESGGYADGS